MPAGRRRGSRRPARWLRRCGCGRGRDGRSTPRSTPRAGGHWLGPGAAPRRRPRPGRSGSVARPCCRRGRPRPSRTRSRCAAPAVGSCAAPQASAASMLARSVRAKAGARLGGAAHTLRGESGCLGEPGGVRGPGTLGQPGVGHGLERERPDAVQQPVPNRVAQPGPARCSAATHPCRRRSPANGSRAGRPRRSPRPPARRGLRGRTPPPAAVRRRRTWPAPTDRAGRRGTTGRSSTDGRPSDRRRSGLRLVGSARTRNRSSRRRVISSTDSVLVRAAASSIASGRPSRDRHRSRTAVAVRLRGVASALCRGAAGEQLDTVGRASAGRARRRPRRRRRAGPGWCTGSAAPGRHRGGEPPEPRPRRGRVRSCRESPRAEASLKGSNSAASPPGPSTAPISTSTTSSAVLALSSLASQTPSAPRTPSGQLAADRDRHRRLPDTARPHDLHEPLAGEQVGQGRHLVVAADELRRHRRKVPGPPWRSSPCRGRERERRAPRPGPGSGARAPAAAVGGRDPARRPAGS